MLDYEILVYKVQFNKKGNVRSSEYLADTEEDAVEYIRSNREKWQSYRLLEINMAIIDF